MQLDYINNLDKHVCNVRYTSDDVKKPLCNAIRYCTLTNAAGVFGACFERIRKIALSILIEVNFRTCYSFLLFVV